MAQTLEPISDPVLSPPLELEDIQGTVLRDHRLPFGAYLFARIQDPTHGREFLRRVVDDVTTAASWWHPSPSTFNLGISYQGLNALGLPESSLGSFSEEFRQGMGPRAHLLGDTGASDPQFWDHHLGTPDVHLWLNLDAESPELLQHLINAARGAHADLTGVVELSRLDIALPPTMREHFGFRDGIGGLNVEGAGDHRPEHGPPIKAGEFIFGYPDSTGRLPTAPAPDVLSRNGTYAALRKLHQDVAAFRRFLAAQAATPDEQEKVAAKMVGRWRSGAPLALAPDRDDPELGADPQRRNSFQYYADDPRGLKTPLGAHIRRINPRDGLTELQPIVDVQRHRIIRRGFAYGPPLTDGVLEDDGVDRGAAFVIMGASLSRQFEFVQRVWINDGDFVGLGDEKDPIIGANAGRGTFTIPKQPIRQRIHGLPAFVTTRGGEYFFLPGLRALRWLATERW